jgi:hypothetical protein
MLSGLLNALFGCSHERTTFPLTPVLKIGVATPRSAINGTYVACLDCGLEFRYDWNEMLIGEPVLSRREVGGRQHHLDMSHMS